MLASFPYAPQECALEFLSPGEACTNPLCHKDNHLTQRWGFPSEENKKAPRAGKRIWFPHPRITLSENVSLSSCYKMRYTHTQNTNQQPKIQCHRRRPCSFVQTVWEGRSRTAELEEASETIKPNTNSSQMRWWVHGWESATAHQDSGLSAPSFNYNGSQGFHLGQEAAETAWAPSLGSVSESGQFFSQGIPSFGLENIRRPFSSAGVLSLWVFQWDFHEKIIAEDFL